MQRIKHALQQPANVAGVLYIFPALTLLAMWGTMLFCYLGPAETPGGILRYSLIESPYRLSLIWLALLPLIFLGLSAAYFSRLAQSRWGAIALLVASIALAIAAWVYTSLDLAFCITVPVAYTVMHLRRVLRG